MARIDGGKVRMLTRRGLDWTARFQPMAAALAKLKASDAYIDGEVAVLDEAGVPSFALLQDALSLKKRTERLVYFAFDLLHLDGRDMQGLPLVERKAKVEALLGMLKKSGPVRYSEHVVGQGPAQAAARRYRLQARRFCLPIGQGFGLAKGEVPASAGIRCRRSGPVRRRWPDAVIAAGWLLRQGQPDLRR
jgi:ATP-dependent DNA ligase